MRMDDPPREPKPSDRVFFVVAVTIVGVATFVVAFYLAALAFT
jgi:hypothetical protein